MAGRLLFVILMYSFHKIQTQALLQPKLTVNPAVITETDSVTLNCQTPSYVSVSQCYFRTVREEPVKSFSCQQTLRGIELLKLLHQTSPAVIKVKCYYSVKFGEINSPSPHSDTSSIIIHSGKPQIAVQHFHGDLIFFTCSLPGSANQDTRCNLYFGEASNPVETTTIWKERTSTKQWFCQFIVIINDFLNRIRLVKQRDASCDYSLGREPNSWSPRSDGYSLNDIVEKESSKAPTQHTSAFAMTTDLAVSRPAVSTFVTHVKSTSDIVEVESHKTQSTQTFTMTTGLTVSTIHTSTPAAPSKQTSGNRMTVDQTLDMLTTKASLFPVTPLNQASERWLLKLGVFAAGFGVTVGVILLGLALVCHKRGTDKFSFKRTQANVTGDFICMANLDHGDLSPAGNDATYSVATSVPGADCATGTALLNRKETQNKDSSTSHVYCTISEEPPPSALKDMVYSNVQAH